MEVLQVKITDADIIKIGEKELIDIITGDLDWGIIEDLLHKKYNLTLSDDNVQYKQGDIVVHNNQVAYKLDFDVNVTISVMFDRQGDCFDIVASSTSPVAPVSDDATGVDAADDAPENVPDSGPEAQIPGDDDGVEGFQSTATDESITDDASNDAGMAPPAPSGQDDEPQGSDQGAAAEAAEKDPDAPYAPDDLNDLGKDNAEMASRIADMISDINRD